MKERVKGSVVIVSLMLSTLLLPATVSAQSYDRRGGYVGLGLAYGFENFGLTELGAGDAPGFDVRAGYRLHPNIALEGDVQYFRSFGLHVDGVPSTPIGELETLALTADAKAYPLTGRVQPYGLAGIGVMRASLAFDGPFKSQNAASFAGRFGAGIDFYVTESVVVNIEATYLLPSSDYKLSEDRHAPRLGGDVIPLVLGVQYRGR